MKVFSPSAQIQHLLDKEDQSAAKSSAKTPLLEGVGERNVTLLRDDLGRVEVILSAAPVTSLVLSGGGAKGIAFSGVVQALEQAGKLQGIQLACGSSAGAISAALIASGMGAAAFDKLSDSIDLPSLLNSKDAVTAWMQDASATLGKLIGRLPGPVGNVSQLLVTLLPRLQTEACPLEELIRNESRRSLLAHIAQSPRETRPAEVMKIADKLSAGGAPTFGDLEVLNRHIPAIKQLSITGTGMFAGRPQLVVFNASLTPQMDIARAAHISGSLPVVFKSPVEQGHGFQAAGEITAFKDGGLLLNTPAPGVVQKVFADSPLNKPEALIVKFESSVSETPARSGSFLSSVADRVIGVEHSAAEAFQEKKLEAFADQIVTLPLKTEKGDFRGLLGGTVNFTMQDEQKQHLQAKACQAVETHLERRSTALGHHAFQSLHDAVLAMDDQLLASVQSALQKDPAAADVLTFRSNAQQALQVLDEAITEANQTHDTLLFTPQILSALRNLDALVRRPEQVDWLAGRLNVADQRNFQQLLQMAARQIAGGAPPVSKVIVGAVAQMGARDIAMKADNFTREVIYPSLFRPGQPGANVELLQRTAQDLAWATTPTEFNRVLGTLGDSYKARNKPWDKASGSTTVEMAQAWRIPVKLPGH
ncbi:patatin-like phospholipase family protein [Pseudomonas fluorescens]|uniref:patatin-like phospholipase family protein n=1 Tax=Pseudomonas fluorescens TaxID=294 RepID=UPI0017824979|nr:patatin-like phospholipase family protein [Pseudomonas fluorescens]MBD8096513.1 patatin-like phospholipase family protein [Pseudomonas fluorescens]MBD8774848.1 patatin-like phospholipase family protein [Pseudomonas fluorescens]MBD8779620.1 patatin-like phospholipase family protein [Pseudomonas fluorescens]MBD8796322.1 patatin-like phospholipase family protein [Pseudomonas fluorescens]